MDIVSDDHPPAFGQLGQPTQPGQTLTLHRRVDVADKEDIDIALRRRFGQRRGEQPLEAEELEGPGLGDAGAVHEFDAVLVGEHDRAARQGATREVPLQLGIDGQGDQGHAR